MHLLAQRSLQGKIPLDPLLPQCLRWIHRQDRAAPAEKAVEALKSLRDSRDWSCLCGQRREAVLHSRGRHHRKRISCQNFEEKWSRRLHCNSSLLREAVGVSSSCLTAHTTKGSCWQVQKLRRHCRNSGLLREALGTSSSCPLAHKMKSSHWKLWE